MMKRCVEGTKKCADKSPEGHLKATSARDVQCRDTAIANPMLELGRSHKVYRAVSRNPITLC
jgi:hypothetical protein